MNSPTLPDCLANRAECSECFCRTSKGQPKPACQRYSRSRKSYRCCGGALEWFPTYLDKGSPGWWLITARLTWDHSPWFAPSRLAYSLQLWWLSQSCVTCKGCPSLPHANVLAGYGYCSKEGRLNVNNLFITILNDHTGVLIDQRCQEVMMR